MVQLSLGRVDLAEKELVRLVEANPEEVVSRQLLAEIFLRQGLWNRAESLWKEALTIDGSNEAIRLTFAQQLVQQGRERDAEELFLAAPALSHSGQAALAYLRSTAADPSVRDPETALTTARRLFAERSTPQLGETIALALAANGRPDEAEMWLKQLIANAQTAGVDEAALTRLRLRLEELQTEE